MGILEPSFPRVINIVDSGCDEARRYIHGIQESFDTIALKEVSSRL